ncbi:MAG: F0F1 ATP synthase subunit delta [Moraxella sp.]|nr:F0F1 ATP synthase subunit delta [Moraxella sp.]
MAELTTLARPYAKAAFEYAKEKNAINDWENFLQIAGNVVTDDAFVGVLHNPAISAEQKTAVLMDVCTSGQPAQDLTNFIAQLAEHDRLALLPEIHSHYSKFKSQELKQVDAYITSAYPLTDEQRKTLQKSLAEREQAIVILHEAIDPSLLGGATIKIGDKFTDGSVRGKLQQLKTQLTA